MIAPTHVAYIYTTGQKGQKKEEQESSMEVEIESTTLSTGGPQISKEDKQAKGYYIGQDRRSIRQTSKEEQETPER